MKRPLVLAGLATAIVALVAGGAALAETPPIVLSLVSYSSSSPSTEANALTYNNAATVSADGRYVAFDSQATDLVAGDTNGTWDVFVRDMQTGSVVRASVGTGGVEGNAGGLSGGISANGRFAFFSSDSVNLVPGDTNGVRDVFVRDLQAGTTTRVSVSSLGAEANGNSTSTNDPAGMSADGRFIVFDSSASNLVPGDSNGDKDIFVHDRLTGTTTRVSTDSAGAEGNATSGLPAISADGQFVSFSSFATNLGATADTNGAEDVFLHNIQTGSTVRVSVAPGGANADSGSFESSVSGDGRFVTFDSDATNLTVGDTNSDEDVFVRDMTAGTTTLVSGAPGAVPANADAFFYGGHTMSDDGRYVIFASRATNLVAGDTNSQWDEFVHDTVTGTTRRIDVNSAGVEGDHGADDGMALSADGTWAAFDSWSSNLVPGTTVSGLHYNEYLAQLLPLAVHHARGALCTTKPLPRADGTTGRFQDVEQTQFADVTDPGSPYYQAVPAIFVQGYGLMCSASEVATYGGNPALYKAAGRKVDGTGVTEGGSGDLYDYYVKS